MADRTDLEEIARAVADGERVDWDDADPADVDVAALRELESLRLAFSAAASRGENEPDGLPPRDRVQFVWGHLQVLELIGSGSSGEVYRAFDPFLQREVALKLWRSDAPGAGPGRRRTLHEARLLARIRHPHVVTVHGADIHDRRAGLWTDLVRGETLEAALGERGPLSADEAALVGIDLCRALAAVHGCGLVHGDVKAANVMREHGGRIVLTDFGAGSENGGDRPLVACGTPLAAAPEVLCGEGPSPAADLYGLGVLLYRLVTARYPYAAASIDELRRLHAQERPTPLTDVRPDLPPAFAAAVERALAARPSERYASAGDMERALAGALSEAGAERFGGRARRWWPALAAAGAALVALAVAVPLLRSAPTRDLRTIRAIAVLPFETGPTTPEHFGPAAAVALRERLAAVRGLEILSTVAALRVSTLPRERGGSIDDGQAAAVLRGSVDASGGRARLALELLALEDGRSLWTVEATARDGSLAAAEEAAGTGLARALGLGKAFRDAAVLDGGETPWQTRHALLAGRFYTDRRTGASLARAVECLRAAIDKNPELATAHAGIARAWARTATLAAPTVPANLAWARSRAAALRALEADPGLAGAHVALAEVAFRHDWDWTIAELELSRALALQPDDPDALEILAELLSVTGRHEDALAAADRTVAAAPWSASARTVAGLVCLEAGRFDRAVEHLEVGIRLDPGYHAAYDILGAVYEERGLAEQAVEQWQNGMVLAGNPPESVEQFGRAFATAGMAGVWHWRLRRLEEERAQGRASAALLARAHAALGHADEALHWLARAVEEHDHHFLEVKEEPAFDALRARPEFIALRDRLGLDEGLVAVSADAAGRPLRIEAALYRDRGGRAEALASGARTRPGDRLFLAVTSPEPIYLYVLNEDTRGELFVLFPLPDLELTNPLPAQRRHRLPGLRDDLPQDWVVTSAGGRETILIAASRAALPEVEVEIGQLRVADAGRPVVPPGAGHRVRGVGGLVAEQPDDLGAQSSRLTRLAAQLAERAARGEVWLQQLVLENPGG